MSQLSRFLDYARAFELACLSDDFSLIEPFFAKEAVHRVAGCEPLGMDDHGREAVVSGLRASVRGIDRRFDARIPEVIEGPVDRDGGVWMRFVLRLRREGLPELRLKGDHLTVYDDSGAIVRIDETMLDGCDVDVQDFLARHDEALRPPESPFAMPGSEDAAILQSSFERTLVRAYAAAKSQQDIEAALSVCHPSFSIETIPFGTTSRDRDETAAQLALFFSVFPDYRAETEGLASGDGSLAWWGRISLTFGGELFGHPPTHRQARIPAFSVFDFRDGLLLRERFFFDLAMLCEGIGLPIEDLSGALVSLRAADAA